MKKSVRRSRENVAMHLRDLDLHHAKWNAPSRGELSCYTKLDRSRDLPGMDSMNVPTYRIHRYGQTYEVSHNHNIHPELTITLIERTRRRRLLPSFLL